MNFATVRIAGGNGALRAENESIRLALPPALSAPLGPQVGREVTLGVRPEDLRIAASDDAPGLCLDAVVEVVEKLGSEILLDVKSGTTTLVARVEPTVRAKVHEHVRLAMNPQRLHFFDAKTEQAL